MEKLSAIVQEQNSGQRLDIFLMQTFPEHSRTFFQNLTKKSLVTVDQKTVKPNHRLKSGQLVDIAIPPAIEIDLQPFDYDLDIIYQDYDIAVINKPQGMVVHPAPGNYSGTLVNALIARLDNLSGINGQIRPGIVHRLDKYTSGLLVIAKNDAAHRHLAGQIKNKTAKRIYWAIVHGVIKQEGGTINAPIGRHPVHRKKMAVVDSTLGKEATTRFKVLERYAGYTLVEASLETGRTHQIRVHMASIGHPVLGDAVYGPAKNSMGMSMQVLHAHKLALVHPSTSQIMEFEAPIPEDFENIMMRLGESSS